MLAAGPGALPGGPLPGGPVPGGAATGYPGRVDTVTVARPSGTVALIRPDAYIGWAQGSVTGDRTPQIRDALTRWCGSAPAG